MINTDDISKQEYFFVTNNSNNTNHKHFSVMRSFRFSPLMAHQISVSAQNSSLSESEFVRRALDAVLKPLFF
jgi:hypothetical protein